MIPTEQVLLQAINSYYPDVWNFNHHDWQEFGNGKELVKRGKEENINQKFITWVEGFTSQEAMIGDLGR